jgi:hypothetical protein
MSIRERHFQGTASTSDATPTPLFTLPALPPSGSFTLTGSVTARAVNGGQQTTFYPVNSGTIIAGAISQSAGRDQAAPCPTSPTDGGTVQGFAPPGCSSLPNGSGQTVALDVNGTVADLMVVGLAATAITWSWDLTLTVQSP